MTRKLLLNLPLGRPVPIWLLTPKRLLLLLLVSLPLRQPALRSTATITTTTTSRAKAKATTRGKAKMARSASTASPSTLGKVTQLLLPRLNPALLLLRLLELIRHLVDIDFYELLIVIKNNMRQKKKKKKKIRA
jgi:hypothetical protein